MLGCPMHMWCNVLKPKTFSRYLVTFYLWISLEHLNLCLNKLWSVKWVLYTSVKCGVWIQVQLDKIWTSKLNSKLKSITYTFLPVLEFNVWFNFGVFNKMNFINNFAQTLVPLVSTKFVLCNDAIDLEGCLLINH